MKPRVLFVGRGRLALPLQPWLQRKWDALADVVDLRVLNAGTGRGDVRFRMLPPDAPRFYPRLPFEVHVSCGGSGRMRSSRPTPTSACSPARAGR